MNVSNHDHNITSTQALECYWREKESSTSPVDQDISPALSPLRRVSERPTAQHL